MNFRVEGMTCGHCERAVTRAVQSIDPAARVTVDRTADRVVVESVADADAVVRAIQAEGYVVDRSAQPCDSGTCSTRRREDERKSAVRSRTARDTPPGMLPSTASCRRCSETFEAGGGSFRRNQGFEPMKGRKQEALQRLARGEGQVRGIARMIEQDRCCIDILSQAPAVRSALSQVEMLILRDQADDCVKDAILAPDSDDQRRKFRELVDAFERVCR